MNLSLNEVEATARKAARGAGYSWGMANEAGRAVRWLCARGLDGCGALADMLDAADRNGLCAPEITEVHCVGQRLCPLMTGCAMADLGGLTVRSAQVHQPLLLLPFAVYAGHAALAAEISDLCPAVPCATRAHPDPADWATLNAFAHRTYAPATEESRLKGAG